MAMTPSFQDVFFQVVIAGGAGSGLFVYSPSAGTGNLIVSAAGTAGTDPYGNAYVEGIGIYGPGTAGLLTYSGPPGIGNLIASIVSASGFDSAGNTILAGITAYDGAGNRGQLQSGGLQVELAANHLVGSLTYLAATAAFYLQAFGGFSSLMTDPLAAVQPGSIPAAPETWHTPGLTGFTNGTPPIQYRLKPDGDVEIFGQATASTAYTAGTTIFTLPTGYLPAATLAIPGQSNGPGVIANLLQVTSAGAVNLQVNVGNADPIFLSASFRLT